MSFSSCLKDSQFSDNYNLIQYRVAVEQLQMLNSYLSLAISQAKTAKGKKKRLLLFCYISD